MPRFSLTRGDRLQPARGAIRISRSCDRERPLGGFDHACRRNPGQAAEVTGRAVPLPAGPAGQLAGIHRLCEIARAPPGNRSPGERWPEQRDDRCRGRRRDVHRPAVAPNVHRRAVCQRPQFAEVEVTDLRHRSRQRSELAACVGDDA
jgi:hypothetical protein